MKTAKELLKEVRSLQEIVSSKSYYELRSDMIAAEDLSKLYHEDGDWKKAMMWAKRNPYLEKHPRLQIWQIVNADEGQVVVQGLNFKQAMDRKYWNFIAMPSGQYAKPRANAYLHPAKSSDFNKAKMYASEESKEKNSSIKLKNIDKDDFTVLVEWA